MELFFIIMVMIVVAFIWMAIGSGNGVIFLPLIRVFNFFRTPTLEEDDDERVGRREFRLYGLGLIALLVMGTFYLSNERYAEKNKFNIEKEKAKASAVESAVSSGKTSKEVDSMLKHWDGGGDVKPERTIGDKKADLALSLSGKLNKYDIAAIVSACYTEEDIKAAASKK